MNNRKVRISLIDYWSSTPNDCFLFQCLNDGLKSRIELNVGQPDIAMSFGFGSSYTSIKRPCIKIKTLFNEPWLCPDDSQFDYYIGSADGSLSDSSKQCYIPFWLGAWYSYRMKCAGVDFEKRFKTDLLNRGFCS